MVEIESAELFRTLSPHELKALRLATVEQEFAAGKEIFRAGDDGDGVYVVKSGAVEISGVLNVDTSKVFSIIEPGGLFGEMAVVEHAPRSATAKARQPSVVYFIPRAEMLTLIENCPGLALSLLRLISHRLRDFNQHYLYDLLQKERLAVLGRFARGIVHDLKNPLNIIGLTAQTICLPGTTEEFLRLSQKRIQKQVERVNDLISELLLFTQGPRPGLLLERLDYAQVLREIVSELQADLMERNCRLELEGEVPSVRVRLDPKCLRRVLINLTNNAADATGPGGMMTLRCSLESSGVVTVIEDNGPGIAPEIVGKLFEAFATHGKPHGTGLGLTICKKFIEDHGGRIWASNRPQGGARFSFKLPMLKEGSPA